ncbi:MAG: hypothetical protein KDE56_09780 [Anaerolineales bacterium]|nr:hypothetical protein [Anaerolineales bacterium]
MTIDTIQTYALYLIGTMMVALILAIILFLVAIWRMKRVEIPQHAGFMETLRYTPFVVVLFIDLLDLSLDFLAAPFAWVILDRLGLKALRGFSTIEALIPFTGPIPTLTLSWIFARLFRD